MKPLIAVGQKIILFAGIIIASNQENPYVYTSD